ncbi:MAG TPA: sugar ABC transporter substrate-binding protein [Chloroflexia bacterium]|nr:sugar ABC transporter substrate-binding protein [Chloroflexia bacterium]
MTPAGGAGGAMTPAGGAMTPAAGTGGATAGISNKYSGATLNMVAANHAWNSGITPLIPEFEKARGMKINIASFGETQLSDQLTVKFTGGGSDVDVFMFRPLQEGRLFAGNNWLADITAATQSADVNWSDFQKPAAGTVTFNDKVYGVPIVTEREILYYRKDLFTAKNITVPKTLDELMAAAEKLHDPGAGMYGFVARGQQSPAVTQFSSFLYSMGGDWAKDGQSAIGSPEAVKAYKFYGDLLHKYGAPGVLNMNWPQAIAIFAQGKAAMYTDADSLYPNLLDKTKSQLTPEQIGYAMFPAGSAGPKPYNVTSWALGVGATSKNKDAAFEFVKWATSQDVVGRLQAGGLPGARTSVWTSPEGTKGFPPELAQVIQTSAANGVDHDRPLVVHVSQARDIIGGPIVASIQGQDVDAAVKQADTQFNDFLKTDSTKK